MRPFEDFAETWAHYLHIETAREYGIAPVADNQRFSRFRDVVTGVWGAVVDRAKPDQPLDGDATTSPFVIPDAV